MVGYGVLNAASDAGLVPGCDFAVIGFDDYVHSRGRGLSTIRRPLDQMGSECVNLLLRAMAGEDIPQSVSIRTELIPRTSTMRWPRQTIAGLQNNRLNFREPVA